MLENEKIEKLKEVLENVFSDYYELGGGVNYRFHHLVSTLEHSRKIVEKEGLDVDENVLDAASLFHDIGRKEDIEDGYLDPMDTHKGHAGTGREVVAEYLEDFLTEEEISKVEKVIGNHHSEPETVEGKVLQDADLLTNYGVKDLWRMIHYSSDKKRSMEEAFEYFWQTHLPRYIEDLEKFHFEVSRGLAKDRALRHQRTIRDMEKEDHARDI